VADDNDVNRTVLKRQLTAASTAECAFEVVCVCDGHEAVDAAVLEHYDVILMDIEMPTLNGLQATAKIREWEQERHLAPIPIVGVSGNARQVRSFWQRQRR